MEALLVDSIPDGSGWQYEPKWDGFRCLAFREGTEVYLQSKSCQPLARYFPEVVEAVGGLPANRFVLDGEIAVPVQGVFSFDDLLQRIHPAESRVRKLAREFPALYIVFDLLVTSEAESLVEVPLHERRALLESFAARNLPGHLRVVLSPATKDHAEAAAWLNSTGGNLDGIIAKRLDFPYASGERAGMEKAKKIRTADCVVGGFRYAEKARLVGSLLLGLYNDAGQLDHVGFCSSFKATEKQALTEKLERLIESPGFTGRAPGGPSRWSTKRSMEWQPLRAELVVEVSYDHFTGGRFRHGTRLLRWRPDKAPEQCRMEQVQSAAGASLELLLSTGSQGMK
jgi:ATP-dependent DNA ligase